MTDRAREERRESGRDKRRVYSVFRPVTSAWEHRDCPAIDSRAPLPFSYAVRSGSRRRENAAKRNRQLEAHMALCDTHYHQTYIHISVTMQLCSAMYVEE